MKFATSIKYMLDFEDSLKKRNKILPFIVRLE